MDLSFIFHVDHIVFFPHIDFEKLRIEITLIINKDETIHRHESKRERERDKRRVRKRERERESQSSITHQVLHI